MQYVIGIDPDSALHGVAVYNDGALVHLDMMDTPDLMDYIAGINGDVLLSIEDVQKKGTWHKLSNSRAAAGVGKNIAMCYQSKVELIRWLNHLGIMYKLHKPSSQWKSAKQKSIFEAATGWTKRSNEDTRSAAYFGMIEVKRIGL